MSTTNTLSSETRNETAHSVAVREDVELTEEQRESFQYGS